MAKGKVTIDVQNKKIPGGRYHYVYTIINRKLKEQKRFLLWGSAKKYAAKIAKQYEGRGYTVKQNVFS